MHMLNTLVIFTLEAHHGFTWWPLLLALPVAPEIIEMSVPSFSCDIWSTGCVVVEVNSSCALL